MTEIPSQLYNNLFTLHKNLTLITVFTKQFEELNREIMNYCNNSVLYSSNVIVYQVIHLGMMPSQLHAETQPLSINYFVA